MRLRRLLLVGLLALPPLAVAGFAFAGSDNSALSELRRATAAFHDPAAADAAGYTIELGDVFGETCIVDLAAPSKGAMGVHLVNGGLLGDAVLDPTKPEALVYEPRNNGTLKLVAAEYVVFQDAWDEANGFTGDAHAPPPELFGRSFEFADGSRFGVPAFWALHAWAWKPNPSPFGGIFGAWNPRVSC
jgi:hypothetical protein